MRFAGDSGDGVQLTGAQFTLATALAGNDLETFPDFPAEIRAPVGTTFGVSAFQINFGARRIYTVGDRADVLVALNPAALKVNLPELEARRRGDPRPGQLRRAQPAQGRPRRRPAPGRHASTATGWSQVDISANTKAATRAHRPLLARPAALQELLRAGPGLLDVRARPGAHRPLARAALQGPPRARRRQHRGTRTPATRWARPPSCTSCRPSTSTGRHPRPASTAPSPATRRWPSACSTAPARPG